MNKFNLNFEASYKHKFICPDMSCDLNKNSQKEEINYAPVKAFSQELMNIIFKSKHHSIIKDFPQEGINFIDINELFVYPEVYAGIGENLSFIVDTLPKADLIIATEARGFLIGSVLAVLKKIPFVPVRKRGKLPEGKTIDGIDIKNYSFASGTEYSTQDLCIAGKAIEKMRQIMMEKNPEIDLSNDNYLKLDEAQKAKVKAVNVIMTDDLLATGTTFKSIYDFLHELKNIGIKVNVVAALSVIDLGLKPEFIASFNYEKNDFDNYDEDKIKSYSLLTIPEDIEGKFKEINKIK